VFCVRITEALVGGRVGNPRGLTGLALARGHARGRDSPRRPPARGRHSLPGVGPTHFAKTLAPTVRVLGLGLSACAGRGRHCDFRERRPRAWFWRAEGGGEFRDPRGHPNRYSFMNCLSPPGRPARGRRPGVGTHPATGRLGVGPGSGLIWLGSP
jgi:hypothetical protein